MNFETDTNEALQKLNKQGIRWIIRRCIDADSIWWELETTAGDQKITRANLDHAVEIALQTQKLQL